MYQANPTLQRQGTQHLGLQNPLAQPQPQPSQSPTELPASSPELGTQQTPRIGNLAAQLADLQARQSSLESHQARQGTQQATPASPSPTARQVSPVLQPSSPRAAQPQQGPTAQQPQPAGGQGSQMQPQQGYAQQGQPAARGQSQSLPGRLRSMIGLPLMGPHGGQGQQNLPPQPQPMAQAPQPMQGGPTHQPVMQQPHHHMGSQLSQQRGPQPAVSSQPSPMQGQMGQGGAVGGQPGQGPPRQRVTRQPPVDIFDEGEHLLLEIEIPGASKEDIHLTGERNGLQLRASTPEHREDETLVRSERGQVTYQRSIPLGIEIDNEEIQAKFEDGILRVKAPKRDPTSGPNRIEVR